MLRSNAGKARISVVWMVVVGLLFLISIGLAFVSQSDLTKERQASTEASQKASTAAAEMEKVAEKNRALSSALGWYDRTATAPEANPEAAKKALEELRGSFPDLGAAEKDYELAIPKIVAAFDERGRKVAELETRIKGLESEVAAAQQATAQVTTDKDATIAELRKQMADDQNNAEQHVKELQGTIDQSRAQLAERDGEVRKVREDAGLEKRKFEGQKAIDDARIAQLSQDTAFARDPFWKQPDGHVLEVSDRLGSGWIDIGANQRVVRGLVFEVRSGRAGDDSIKALAEVTAVKANSAEVQFTNVADRFSPPTAGDSIANRLYDPVGGRNAVLVGRFSGTFNDQDLKTLLAKMGIQVQGKVDKTTHFLIVGAELWNDPETGEPLSEPRQPSDMPEYKQAEALGVQVVPLQDLREYFRLGAGQ